jgi:hypothetical protein
MPTSTCSCHPCNLPMEINLLCYKCWTQTNSLAYYCQVLACPMVNPCCLWKLLPFMPGKALYRQLHLPLRVCKAISIYKSQGMTVGPGCDWGYIVVGLPGPNDRSNGAGQELVGMSRATDIIYLAFADDEPISLDMFLKLGKGKACDKKREFKQKLKNRQAAS